MRESTIERAGSLNLNGDLGEPVYDVWEQAPTEAAVALARRLREQYRKRALLAAARSNGRLDAALSLWVVFDAQLRGRVAFVYASGSHP
jgi:hypothetical protein